MHLTSFPKADPRWQNAELEKRWDRLLAYREEVQGLLEGMRRNKEIGSSLEARVTVLAKPEVYDFLKPYQDDLRELFIVSQVGLEKDPTVASDIAILRQRADGAKCARCWNYRPAVGTYSDHPTLCDRCYQAIADHAD